MEKIKICILFYLLAYLIGCAIKNAILVFRYLFSNNIELVS